MAQNSAFPDTNYGNYSVDLILYFNHQLTSKGTDVTPTTSRQYLMCQHDLMTSVTWVLTLVKQDQFYL